MIIAKNYSTLKLLILRLIDRGRFCYNYDGLWKLLIDRKMKRKDLADMTHITSATMAKMSKEKPVSMEIIGRICEALDCQIGDIVEVVKTEQ